MKKRLGEILLERGLIDVDQLNSALAHQRNWGMRLGTALVAKGFIAEGMLTRVLSESLGIPMVDLARVAVDARALQLVPRRVAEQYEVFPIALKEQQNGRRVLLLAMADPLNAVAIDEVAFTTDAVVKPAIAQISSLEQAIKKHYYGQRVDVAPLTFDRKIGSVDSEMTIIGRDHQERVVGTVPPGTVPPGTAPPGTAPPGMAPPGFNPAGQPPGPTALTLTDEVTDRAAIAQLRREFAARDLAEPPMLTKPPPDYSGHPTGVFSMALLSGESFPVGPDDVLSVTHTPTQDAAEALEKKFWALMRVLARRGLVTKEEFLAELRAGE